MAEVMVDIRNYDLADRLKLDMISVDSLLNELENALDEIDRLKEQIKEYENPNNYDTEEDFLEIWKRHKENDR